ncbi:hypothetical protein F5J12DRAFT_728082 [Pisolithus orientalis]|uniref:uncharacterized protein n=1 Tax=Pisolithus orientalis TaxID=936130 RepID=UPI0022247837|nr:uncharacterized protein F5J12DRAFT_728082 [Pisolithus orientalis]KAI5988686.1 hypothetical protein F5J12DRAFT_728082 [Pisolithus orientalis]
MAHVHRHDHGLPFSDDWTTGNESQQLIRFKNSWESFIDSLLREWKTLNLVSALLLSATLSMFTNQEIACNPAIRSMALLSLTFALMSLSYGCIYIVQFSTMKSMYKATRWAQEVQGTSTNILWNVWIMLALPGVWLAWSMILFIASILVFVWRSGSTTDPSTPSSLPPTEAYTTKTFVSFFFFVGGIYFSAIVNTLHGYGRVKAGEAVAEAAARETRDPRRERRESRDVDREMEMGATGIKEKGHRGKVVMVLWVHKSQGHTYIIKCVYSTHEYTYHCIVSYIQWTFVKIPCIVHYVLFLFQEHLICSRRSSNHVTCEFENIHVST